MNAIEVKNLHFSYPDGTSVLHGVDLAVAAGERVAILGPNGAGKTTLLLHLIGVLEPGEGTVRVEGNVLSADTLAEARRRVGLVFQDPDDQLFMPTVGQDVAFGPANYGLEGSALQAAVKAALQAVSAEDLIERAPHHLSGGEQRRVAIATVLAMSSDILVLDEPTSSLDPAGRRELVALLQGLGATTLVTTHDLPFALELCPRAVIMDGGRVVADGDTGQLLSDRQLLHTHRLELPYGFDPANIRPA
ncbi:MAG TPA: ABC transporter ATP-binding protein [Acidimicrobiia bacterium]|nr:ABC transporter ATP-binding protein [Acidimicrobiia bacterium]